MPRRNCSLQWKIGQLIKFHENKNKSPKGLSSWGWLLVDSWGFGIFFCWLTPEDGDGMEAVFYNFCGPGHVTLMANNVYASCGVQLGGGVKISQLEEIVTWFFLCFFSLAFQTVQYCEGGGIRETRNFLWVSHWMFCREFRATRVFTSANRVTLQKETRNFTLLGIRGDFSWLKFFRKMTSRVFPVRVGGIFSWEGWGLKKNPSLWWCVAQGATSDLGRVYHPIFEYLNCVTYASANSTQPKNPQIPHHSWISWKKTSISVLRFPQKIAFQILSWFAGVLLLIRLICFPASHPREPKNLSKTNPNLGGPPRPTWMAWTLADFARPRFFLLFFKTKVYHGTLV